MGWVSEKLLVQQEVPHLSRGWPVCLAKHSWLKAHFEIPALCFYVGVLIN